MLLKCTFLAGLSLSLAVVRAEDEQGGGLDGTWLPTAAELGGKMFPDEVRKSIRLVIAGDKYKVTIGDKVDEGTVKRDPEAEPKQLDITGTDGPNKGRTILAIYELTGDTLRVCYDLGGKNRPTEFKTTEGSPLFLVTYQREKP